MEVTYKGKNVALRKTAARNMAVHLRFRFVFYVN